MDDFVLPFAIRLDEIVDPVIATERDVLEQFSSYLTSTLVQGLGANLEREGRFPDSELSELARRGLIEAFVPHECGGRANWRLGARFAFRFAAHEPDVALCFGGTILGTLPIMVAGSLEQKTQISQVLRAGKMAGFGVSELRHGLDMLGSDASATPMDAAGIECSPEKVVGYRLSGTKAPVNNASEGEALAVLLRTAPGRELDSQSLFFFTRTEATPVLGERFENLGYRCMDLSSIVLDGVAVEKSALVGKLGEGFHHTRRVFEISRGGVAAMAAGAQTRALALAAHHAFARRLYGDSIWRIPSVRGLLLGCFSRTLESIALARMAVNLTAHSALTSRFLTCAAKMRVPALLEETMQECGVVLGARSLFESLPFARLRRTAPVYSIFDGSVLVQKEELWRSLLTWAKEPLAKTRWLQHMQALGEDANSFDPHAENRGLTEALTPSRSLFAASELLERPDLLALAHVAVALANHSAVIRGGSNALRHVASECASTLYAVSALASFASVASADSRAILLAALDHRMTTIVPELRIKSERLGLETSDVKQVMPPAALIEAAEQVLAGSLEQLFSQGIPA